MTIPVKRPHSRLSMCSECTSILVFDGVSVLSVAFTFLQSIRREAPKIGGSFAVWGGLFSTFDCTLVALRKKVRDDRQKGFQPTAVPGHARSTEDSGICT